MASLTPAQQQYHDLKKQYPDCILLFRMGDFYETFYDDATTAHKVLHITLTSRDKNSENPIPMAGIPYHALDRYLPKLVKAGYKVAIAEQQGVPVPGKIVERAVTQVVTPGTLIEEGNIVHYIASIAASDTKNGSFHIARGDISLGTFRTKTFDELSDAIAYLQYLQVQELVIDPALLSIASCKEVLQKSISAYLSIADTLSDSEQIVRSVTNTGSLAGFGKAVENGRLRPLGQLFAYLTSLMGSALRVTTIAYEHTHDTVHCDMITYKNLEVFQSSYDGSQRYSLYGILNACVTAMGSRTLRAWLSSPTADIALLNGRLHYIHQWVDNTSGAASLCTLLEKLPDIPRLLTKVLSKNPSFILLVQLRNSLRTINLMRNELLHHGLVSESADHVDMCLSVLNTALSEEGEKAESCIKLGYDSELDRLGHIAYHADELLVAYQQELQGITGVSTIKIKFVTNQGYFFEVAKKDAAVLEKATDTQNPKLNFIRRQTLKGGERYVTSYLQELQGSIIDAQALFEKKQQEILLGLCEAVRLEYSYLLDAATYVGVLDVVVSMGLLAQKYHRTKPMLHSGYELHIRAGRHPVVEAYLPSHEQFIPNDTTLGESSFFHLITGPNMGGKSTYLRQNALLVLMAHCGLWIPASEARIPLVDGIFARVGSGDVLAKNQSTFLTEMLEVANILHHATRRSFIVLDELGRGTSTYDGLSLAKSISVYICKNLHCKTLFATHYHELQDLENSVACFINNHVTVYENNQDIVFLKKIAPGGADRSYGLEVAKLAGIPTEVLKLAKEYLTALHTSGGASKSLPTQPGLSFEFVESSADEKDHILTTLKTYIDEISVENTTPVEALIALQKIKMLLTSIQ